jgi:hypothetical protein
VTREDEELVKEIVKREAEGSGCAVYIPWIAVAAVTYYNPEPLRQGIKSIIQWALK